MKTEAHEKLTAAASYVWKEIVTVASSQYPLTLPNRFGLVSDQDISAVALVIKTIDQNPILRTQALNALVEYFFMTAEFDELLERYHYDSSQYSDSSKSDLKILEENFGGSSKQYILSTVKKTVVKVLQNRSTLFDIEALKDEDITQLLLDSVKVPALSFESLQSKVSRIEETSQRILSGKVLLDFTQDFRLITHYLSYLLQVEFEKFNSNVIWVQYRNAQLTWSANPSNIIYKNAFLRLNYQAMVLTGQHINHLFQALYLIPKVQGQIDKQEGLLREWFLPENATPEQKVDEQIHLRSVVALKGFSDQLKGLSKSTQDYIQKTESLEADLQGVLPLVSQGKSPAEVKKQ